MYCSLTQTISSLLKVRVALRDHFKCPKWTRLHCQRVLRRGASLHWFTTFFSQSKQRVISKRLRRRGNFAFAQKCYQSSINRKSWKVESYSTWVIITLTRSLLLIHLLKCNSPDFKRMRLLSSHTFSIVKKYSKAELARFQVLFLKLFYVFYSKNGPPDIGHRS